MNLQRCNHSKPVFIYGRVACTIKSLAGYYWTKSMYKSKSKRVLLEQLTGSQLVKKFPAFDGTRRFTIALEEPATSPYPEADQSSPCSSIPLPEDSS